MSTVKLIKIFLPKVYLTVTITVIRSFFRNDETKNKKRLDKEVKICYNKSRCENNYKNFISFEPLAQAAEHLPFKQGVPGSIPGWLTKILFYTFKDTTMIVSLKL